MTEAALAPNPVILSDRAAKKIGRVLAKQPEGTVLRDGIRQVAQLTKRPFGVNLNLQYPQEEWLEVSIDEGVGAVSLFWGLSESMIRRARDAGMLVIQTVGSAAEARQAIELGAEIIIAQGWEAGGHVWGKVGTLALVPAVVDAAGPIPVIAAGGIADGRGLAAALALGASGAWIGTRFLLAHEATLDPDRSDVIRNASEADTVMGKDANPSWLDSAIRWIGGEAPESYRPAGSQLAGQGVGLVKRQQPAAEIVAEIWAEAKATMTNLSEMR